MVDIRELISGRSRGATAGLGRLLLGAAEVPYRAAVFWRNRRYDRGRAAIHRVDVPVVSVGNLTVGGTGKTPMVAWLARWFRQRGVRVCLISRGYGAEAGSRNDEALELEQELPDVPHLQNPDRVAAARTAIEEFETQLILLDDAFQHRRIHRDLDLVLIDALQPFGYDHLLPRGLLREPPHSLARADVVVLSRCDLISDSERKAILQRVRQLAPRATLVHVVHSPQSWTNASGHRVPIEHLAGCPVIAFCGVGNPDGFHHTLDRCGVQLAGFREFADHHNYTAEDLSDLEQWTRQLQASAAVCTRKDLVKIQCDRLGPTPLWSLAIGTELVAGREEFESRLQELLGRIAV